MTIMIHKVSGKRNGHHFLEGRFVAETASAIQPNNEIFVWVPSVSVIISDLSFMLACLLTGETSTISTLRFC